MNIQVTEEQLGKLEQAINSSPYPELRLRVISIRLLGKGLHPEKVAEMVVTMANNQWCELFWAL